MECRLRGGMSGRMNESVMYRLLELIDRKASVSSLFKMGYPYSKIVKWYMDLEAEGYIRNEDGEYKLLTKKGRNRLAELKKRRHYEAIGKLEQYRIPKKPIEDIYLP